VIDQDFWIDRYPVTNAEYAEFLNSPASKQEFIDLDDPMCRIAKRGQAYEVKEDWHDHPTTQVSWFGAAAYAEWAGKVLPDERRWEKEARGIDGRPYPFRRWDGSRCNTAEQGAGKTTPYSLYAGRGESPYSCLDMAGNVWEWMADWYDSEEKKRVLRGGAWNDVVDRARSAYRFCRQPARTA